MNVRPALIPEKVRPLVLSPIYLLRTVIRILFWIARICLLIVVVIVAPIPIMQDIISVSLFYKILLAIILLGAIFGPAAKYLSWLEREILELLDRVERLAAGDILEAATLAYDLSRGAAHIATDYTLQKARQSTEAAEDLARRATALSLHAYDRSQRAARASGQRASRATGVVLKSTGHAAGSTGVAARQTTVATGRALHNAADVASDAAHDMADEATHLLQKARNVRLQNPTQTLQHMGEAGVKFTKTATASTANTTKRVATQTVTTTKAAGRAIVVGEQALVHNVGKASHVAYDTGLRMGHVAVDKSQLAAHQTFRLVKTAEGVVLVVASQAVQVAIDNLQKLLQLNPIVIFKRVVKLVLKALLYLIIGAPIILWITGKVLWKLGIQPSALEALCLAWFLAIVVCPAFVYFRWKILEQLNRAGGELIHMSILHTEEKESRRNTEDIV